MWYASGGDPYDSVAALGATNENTNPPLFVWLLQWLTAVPEPIAFGLWTLAGAASLAAALRAIGRELGIPPWRLALVALPTQAFAIPLVLGQVTWLLMWPMTCAWVAFRRGDDLKAGLWLGPMMYLKPFLGLYALVWLWRGRWRGVAAALGSGAGVALLGLVLVGVSAQVRWIETLRSMSYMAPHLGNASIRALTTRLLTVERPQSIPVYEPIAQAPGLEPALWISAVFILFVLLLWRETRSRDAEWGLVGLTSLLMSPLGWVYYLPFWLGALAAIASRWMVGPWLLLAVPPALLLPITFSPLGGLTIGSVYLWGVLGCWLVVFNWRAAPSRVGTSSASGSNVLTHSAGRRDRREQ